MNRQELASYIDATIVKNNNTLEDAERLAEAAKKYRFKTVFTLPCYTAFMAERLKETGIGIGSVAGFPWGGEVSEAKAYEAVLCIKNGADEVDMVINLGYFFSGRYELVREDIECVRKAAGEKTLKCIIESSMLSDEQIITATNLSIDGGADFVKCCTGFHGGAEIRHVDIMARAAKGRIKIKASGGIRTADDAERFISAGADRLGIGADSAVNIIKSI